MTSSLWVLAAMCGFDVDLGVCRTVCRVLIQHLQHGQRTKAASSVSHSTSKPPSTTSASRAVAAPRSLTEE